MTNNLDRPIPLLDDLREQKKGYKELPIDTSHRLHNEPLVVLQDYGIAGQSYYSRPNSLFDTGLDGIPPEIQVRRSVAETLQYINKSLAYRSIQSYFGGEVELYIEEGVRLGHVQQQLYDEEIPAQIRKNSPDLTDSEVNARRDAIIAKPTIDTSSPAPHASGGAVDVVLRHKQPTLLHVPQTHVPIGLSDGDTTDRIYPDYYEINQPTTKQEVQYMRNRRALYNIMSGRALGELTGFAVNPTEIFHWDKGTQLWSVTSGLPPYYGLPPDIRP